MIKVIGWIGTQLLAWCALPQVISTVKAGTAGDINPMFLAMWGIGEILTLIYVYRTVGTDWPLLTNYSINLTCIGILCYYLL